MTHCRIARSLPAVALTLALGFVLGACSQAKITGRVLDEQHKPILGAAIGTEPPTDLLVTNHLGRFSLERVLDEQSQPQAIPPGKYKLVIKKLGFQDKVVPIVLKKDELAMGDILMEPKQLQVDVEGDVTSSKDVGPVGTDLRGGVYLGE